MRLKGFAALAAIVLASCSTTATTPATDTASMTSEDPYLWLEEVEGETGGFWSASLLPSSDPPQPESARTTSVTNANPP